jgi:PhnB protein
MAETAVRPIPRGYRTATPYLIVDGAARAIDFYKKAFRAKEIMRLEQNGKIGHAEIQVGNSRIMLADEFPDMDARGPKSIGGSPVSIHLYVKDADKTFTKAVKAGAKVKHPLEDKFYGDRTGSVEDPYGHVWHVATHKEDLTAEEISNRAATMKTG